MAPQPVTLTANGRALLGGSTGAMAFYLHVRAASVLGGGTLGVQYAVVDSPDLTNNQHWETLEGLAGLTPGQSRPIRWPGTLALAIAGATSPNIVADVIRDRA